MEWKPVEVRAAWPRPEQRQPGEKWCRSRIRFIEAEGHALRRDRSARHLSERYSRMEAGCRMRVPRLAAVDSRGVAVGPRLPRDGLRSPSRPDRLVRGTTDDRWNPVFRHLGVGWHQLAKPPSRHGTASALLSSDG